MKVPWNGPWPDYSGWPPSLYLLLPINFGSLGVPLFFVLSGFCIQYSTMKRPASFSIGDFYWRRFLRIYPAYLVCVLLCTPLAWAVAEKYFGPWQVITHVLMIHNFWKATFGGLDGPLWSLGVEMQFYLLYPFLLLVLRRRFSWGQCLALALACNLVLYLYFGFTSKPYELTHTRPTFSFPLMTWCDWILGAALADAYVRGEPLFPRHRLWLVGSAVMLLVALNFRPLYTQAFLFASVFFAVGMQCYLGVRAPLWRVERGLVPVGLISYSLYLWHVPVLQLSQRWAQTFGLDSTNTPVAFAAFSTVVSAAVVFPWAWLSYRVLEIAVPRWLATTARKKRAPAVADVAAG